MVTNGPLLQPKANGKLPGYVFFNSESKPLDIQITLSLSTRDKIHYMEVIKNGETVHEVRLSDWKKARGKLPPIRFEKSGWFLIRAVTSVPKTYRFASSAPYYVSIGGKKRISKQSAKFFLDWVNKRKTELVKDKIELTEQWKSQLNTAIKYWQEKVNAATVQ